MAVTLPAEYLHRLVELFIGFFRASILGYGGGPAAIPLLEAEAVEHFGWLTQEEFATALAAGNSLPGPILTKMAAYIGYHVAGWLGALVGLVTTVLPTAILMIGLIGILQRFSQNPVVAGMLKGVRPVVWILFVSLAIDYLAFVRSGPAIVIAAAALAGIYVFHLHPAVLVAGALVVGALFLR